MLKFIKKNILSISVLIMCLGIFIPQTTFAKLGDMNVIFSHQPLFQKIGIVPGDTASETITVTNNSEEEKTIGIKFIGTSTHELDQKLFFTIRENTTTIFGGPGNPKTLADLLGQGEISITKIIPGATKILIIDADFSVSAGNLYQKKSSVFDIEVGFVYSALPLTNTPSTVKIQPLTQPDGQVLGEETVQNPAPAEKNITVLGVTLPITGASLAYLITISLVTVLVATILLLVSRDRKKIEPPK